MDDIRKTLPKKLRIDTQTWGPRRFALVRLVDGIAQEVYMEMGDGIISPRHAEELLGHLGMAAWYLYRPGSQRRRLMSPSGGRRRFPSFKKSFHRRLGSSNDDSADVRIPVCGHASKSGRSRKGYMNGADKELRLFKEALEDMDIDAHDWEDRATAIQDALPFDVEYIGDKSKSKSRL